MKTNFKTAYWIATLLFVVPLGLSGLTYLLKAPFNVDGMHHLRYPVYFMNFLGTAKILGVLAIVTDKSRTLKEWAYAGFTFDLLAAAYSHYYSGDGLKLLMPLTMLAIMFVSYYFWRRRLGAQAAA